jgi:hypothetical protein
MATVMMMRCIVPHWQGNKFIAQGAVLPGGHPDIIDEFFVAVDYEVGDDSAEKRKAK